MRVDTSSEPIEELARLLRFARAYEALDTALGAIAAGELELVLAGTTLAHRLAPEDALLSFWQAAVLEASGRPDEAQVLLRVALASEPRLATFAQRFADAGHADLLETALRAVPRRPGSWHAPARPTDP